MSLQTRILGVAASSNGLDWFRSALGADADHLVVVGPGSLPADLNNFDAAVLDEGIGPEQARLAIADLHVARTSLPVLAGVDAANWLQWGSLIRLGLQDILFRDLDRPPEMLRRLAGAIHQSRVLHATQEAEIRLRTIIENIEDGVLIIDDHNVILFANPAAEDLLGRTLDELFGLEIPFAVPRKDEDTVLFEQGDVRSLHVRTYDVTWEGRDAALITLRDMTAEQEIREQLRLARRTAEEASAMKSTFLANMSHELRMPLASIIGFAQIIGEGTENPDFKEFAEAIEYSGNRLLKTINAVLEATRLEKLHIDPFLQTVRIDTVVEEVVTSLKPLVQNERVTLGWQGQGSPEIMADEDFVIRILNNLVGNAAK